MVRLSRESRAAERAVIALSLALGVPMVFLVSLCQIGLPLLNLAMMATR